MGSNKQLMVYLAMAFGNPYGDENTIEIIQAFTEKLVNLGIHHISLSDIIGVAKPEFIAAIYKKLSSEFPEVSFGMHLHIHPQKANWRQKLEAAYKNGCIRFDGVINGMGGCPLSGYEMLGNLPTGHILRFANDNQLIHQINMEEFKHAKSTALRLLK